MVTNTIPLKFEFDGLSPSSLAEFVPSDVVGPANGGTGSSSLANFASSLITHDVSANSVSAGTIKGTLLEGATVSATNFLGKTLKSVQLSGTTVSAISVSSTSLSSVNLKTSKIKTTAHGVTVSGAMIVETSSIILSFSSNPMPIPPPFAYIQLTADDAASTDTQHVGYSNTPTVIASNPGHITWSDGAKQFNVSAAGTYECMGCITFEGGATLVTCKVNKNGTAVLTVIPRVHSTVDPVERTVRAIFTAAAGDNVDITYDSNSGNTVKAITGTTVTLKRLI